jgi:hypothetical protein
VTVLTAFDDYPIHQTGHPIAVPATGDANHYDRFFFNGYTPDASLYFGVALGLYPNRAVIDGSFSVLRHGEQVNVHAAGECPLDRTRPAVGPLGVEIVEPMRVLRVVVDAPEHGLAADVVFRSRTAPIQEPRFVRSTGIRLLMDYTRLTQLGSWEGWVSVDGVRHELPAGTWGSRDRSWGIRPVGDRLPGPASEPQFSWLWAPVNFPSCATHFDVNEDATGRRWHESGFLVPLGEDEPVACDVDYRITNRPGTRWADGFALDLDGPGGRTTVELSPVATFLMKGVGYGHPEHRHGQWKGASWVLGDRWRVADVAPLRPDTVHIQELCRATLRRPDGATEEGLGILEQFVIGRHDPRGFRDVLDGAAG